MQNLITFGVENVQYQNAGLSKPQKDKLRTENMPIPLETTLTAGTPAAAAYQIILSGILFSSRVQGTGDLCSVLPNNSTHAK